MARLVLPFRILRNSHHLAVNERRNERRMARYANLAFSMPPQEFRKNYRLTPEVFEKLFDVIKPYLPLCKRKSDITARCKLLVALSFFATGSYQRLVGNNNATQMSQQSVSRCIRDVCYAFNNAVIQSKWIKFPLNRQERDAIKRRFYEEFKIPAVLGCIDGTHVAIIRPSVNEERFFNRKHFHSRNVMIICDADYNILSVDATFGGASHDSFVWNQHPVKEHLINLTNSGENVYLLGDSGYAQREYLMTPIINAAEGSPEEYYTKLHVTARAIVERTIGILKNRWRCLLGHRVLHYHPNVAARIINACCVLHNFCNKEGLFINADTIMSVSSDNASNDVQHVIDNTAAADLRRGIAKRAALVQQLWASRT